MNNHSTRSFSWKNDTWVRPYLGRYKRTLALAISLGAITVFFAAALMFTSGWLIGGSAEMPYSILLLGTPLLCVRIFGIGKPVLQYAERLTSHDWVLRMTSSLRAKLYRAFDEQGIFFRSTHRLGNALGFLAEDIGHIQNLYLRTVLPTAIAWILGLILVIAFGVFSWWTGLLVLLILVAELVVVPLVSVSANGAHQAKHKTLKTQLYADLTDDVMGITDWILSGRRHDYLERHAATQSALRELEREAHTFDRRRDLVLQILFALGALLVIAWAAMQFGEQGHMNANWILAFILGYFPLLDAFAPLSSAAVEARSHQDAIERLNALPCVTGNDADTPDNQPSVPQTAPDQPLDLVLQNVHFTYPESSHETIKGIDLTIRQGEHIAVLGKSGTGKSTLALLLRGDLTPTAGSVSVGGVTCSALENDAARYFGVIQQSTYLFNTTLRDNLLIADPHASDATLLDTLSRVGLDSLLQHLPEGLDTMVDEAGLRFSGGERHRIALARILLQDAPIVILDEPMVGLDPATEHQVLSTLFDILRDKTLIMVTHHLQGVSHMDRVLFLQDGHIAISGSPQQLAETNEYYQRLIALDRGIE
ncbi:MAG: thiol reductant ABC exporter subunit CydC [Eggerthellaceae bacterium]